MTTPLELTITAVAAGAGWLVWATPGGAIKKAKVKIKNEKANRVIRALASAAMFIRVNFEFFILNF